MHEVQLVGILNLTADSFSGDGVLDMQGAVARASQLRNDGASFLDVGAESTRPGAHTVSQAEEWQRLQPVLSRLIQSYPGIISVDSYHPATIKKAHAMIGPFIINDVTGFNNPRMIALAAALQLTCIVSHLPRALGQAIQKGHHLEHKIDSVDQVRDELLETQRRLIEVGVKKDAIILDPGIGFGKTVATNWKLLSFASEVPNCPVMIGYSRKSFLGEERMELAKNLEAGQIAVNAGARYLRLHGELLAAHYAAFCK